MLDNGYRYKRLDISYDIAKKMSDKGINLKDAARHLVAIFFNHPGRIRIFKIVVSDATTLEK